MKRNLKGKNSFKNIVLSFFLLLFSAVAIYFLASTNWKLYQKKTDLKLKASELQIEAEALEEKNKKLKEELAYVQSGEYLEKMARDQLDLKKPGEEVIVVQKENSYSREQEKKSDNWWERVKSIFTK